MALIDLDGKILIANEALCTLLGRPRSELLGHALRRMTHPADVKIDRPLLRDLRAGKRTSFTIEKRLLRSDGSVVFVDSTVSIVADHDGAPLFLIAQFHDITARRESEESLRTLASIDDLTKLCNRRAFLSLATQARERAAADGNPALILYIDVDGFKAINDRYGHAAGDNALRTVAELLTATLRKNDLVARQGGDEFVALVVCESGETPDTVLTRLSRRFSWYNATRVLPFRLAVTIGAILVEPGDQRSIAELIDAADAALYEQKRGRGTSRTSAIEPVTPATPPAAAPNHRLLAVRN